MSALAIIALSQGYRVSGSDARAGAQLDAVREAGATCFVGHDARHVGGSDAHDDARDDEALTLVDPPDLVVVSSAVPGDNVEVAFARRAGIPALSRAVADAITPSRGGGGCGTHGKTSTSAALAVALRSAGLDVSAVVGGNVPQFPGGRTAARDDVCRRADEYDALLARTRHPVLLNVEHDHPDMFKDERAVVAMFARFVRRVRPGGLVGVDDANVRAPPRRRGSTTIRDADDPDPRDAGLCVTFGVRRRRRGARWTCARTRARAGARSPSRTEARSCRRCPSRGRRARRAQRWRRSRRVRDSSPRRAERSPRPTDCSSSPNP